MVLRALHRRDPHVLARVLRRFAHPHPGPGEVRAVLLHRQRVLDVGDGGVEGGAGAGDAHDGPRASHPLDGVPRVPAGHAVLRPGAALVRADNRVLIRAADVAAVLPGELLPHGRAGSAGGVRDGSGDGEADRVRVRAVAGSGQAEDLPADLIV